MNGDPVTEDFDENAVPKEIMEVTLAYGEVKLPATPFNILSAIKVLADELEALIGREEAIGELMTIVNNLDDGED